MVIITNHIKNKIYLNIHTQEIQRLHKRKEIKQQLKNLKQTEKQKYYNELKEIQNMNEEIEEKKRLELQKQQEFEENEEKMKNEAIRLLSDEMKKDYEARMKKLELNSNTNSLMKLTTTSENEKGNKRKWVSESNSDAQSLPDIDGSDLTQSHILNDKINQDNILNQVANHLNSKSKSSSPVPSNTNGTKASNNNKNNNNSNGNNNKKKNDNDNGNTNIIS